ncbi:urease accessory protein UreE [Frateuria aurantia]
MNTPLPSAAATPLLRVSRHQVAAEAAAIEAEPLPLPLAARQRSRMRWRLADGRELAWALPAGTRLLPGDLLETETGPWFRVDAANEHVLLIRADAPQALTRAAYHLGNRHIPVEVGPDYLAIEPDPVLRAMLDQLGVRSEAAQAPFQPEHGAYGGGHRHGHEASFQEDYALAQALFVQHQPDGP